MGRHIRFLGFVLMGPFEQERSWTRTRDMSSAAPTEANHNEGSKVQNCGRVMSSEDLVLSKMKFSLKIERRGSF